MRVSKVALITGASRGIGRELALGLASDGYAVALVARDRNNLDQLKQQLDSANQACTIYALDVSNAEAVAACVEQLIAEWGRIDLLINNAGVNFKGTLELDAEQFNYQLAVNVGGAFNFCKYVVPHMRRAARGRIINVSSVAGKVGFATAGGYCASKFALSGLTQSLYRELLAEGIHVTSLCPSWVDTDMAQHSGLPPEKRIAPADILRSVRFIAALGESAALPELIIECRADPL